MKYPDTAELAELAFEASEAKTHKEFAEMIGVTLRAFHSWKNGDKPASKPASRLMHGIHAGWADLEHLRALALAEKL
jgi:hypothetical protein